MDIEEALKSLHSMADGISVRDEGVFDYRYADDGQTVYLLNADFLDFGCDHYSVSRYIDSTLAVGLDGIDRKASFVTHLLAVLFAGETRRVLLLDGESAVGKLLEKDMFLAEKFQHVFAVSSNDETISSLVNADVPYDYVVSIGVSRQKLDSLFGAFLPQHGVALYDQQPGEEQVALIRGREFRVIDPALDFGNGPLAAGFWGVTT